MITKHSSETGAIVMDVAIFIVIMGVAILFATVCLDVWHWPVWLTGLLCFGWGAVTGNWLYGEVRHG